MRGVLDGLESFLDGLTTIAWAPLALAVVCHLGRIAARTRAWRNVVAAAYPEGRVRYRDIWGAYTAGIGANALLPGRGGDLLRLYLIRHRLDGSTYPTLAATLLAETVFDAAVGSVLLGIALATGVLPGVDARLPAVEWLWVFRHPGGALLIVVAFAPVLLVLVLLVARYATAFWSRVQQGLAILRQPRRYFTTVVPWQALDWGFRVAAIYFFLHAFELPRTIGNVFSVQVTQSLATLLPLTPGGIGTEQALLVYVLRGEAATSEILSFSVGMKLVIIAVNVALGAIAVLAMLRSLRWREAVSRDAEASAAAGESR